jgi:hypothetical protein
MHQMNMDDQFHAPAAVEGKTVHRMEEKVTEGGSTQHNGKQIT